MAKKATKKPAIAVVVESKGKKGYKNCPHCSASIPARSSTCPKCGEAIEPKSPTVKRGKHSGGSPLQALKAAQEFVKACGGSYQGAVDVIVSVDEFFTLATQGGISQPQFDTAKELIELLESLSEGREVA